MSMYEMMFGQNPVAPLILEALALPPIAVGRFRDAFVSSGEFAVYTRNGGGNREHYGCEGEEEGEDCFCTGCIMTYQLPSIRTTFGTRMTTSTLHMRQCTSQFQTSIRKYLSRSIPETSILTSIGLHCSIS